MLRKIVIGVSLILICTGCSWVDWVNTTQKVAVTYERVSGQGCGTFADNRAIYATNCNDWLPTEYFKAHEEAHGIAINIGLAYGDGIDGQEKAADVLAYLHTGITGPYWPNGIPAEALDYARSLLNSYGIVP